MALPVGHGFVGAAIAKKLKVNPFLAIILANLPDIDFLFGLFLADGNMLAFHRSPLTHSPFFGIFIALLLWLWGATQKKAYTIKQLVGIWLIVTSHWVIDFIVLPYRFDIAAGKNGLFDFIFAHVISADAFWNVLVDLAVYGTLYVLIVKFVLKEKKLF